MTCKMSDGYYEDSWIPTDNNVYVQIVQQINISDNSNTQWKTKMVQYSLITVYMYKLSDWLKDKQ